MKLIKFKISYLAARSPGHGDSIATGPIGVAGIQINFAGTACGKYHGASLEQVHMVGFSVQNIGALAVALLGDQVDGNTMGENFDIVGCQSFFNQYF